MQPVTPPPPAVAPGPVPTRHHPEPLLDTSKAFAIALREVCLPAVRTNRPVADLAPAADALPVDPKLGVAT